MLRSFRVENHKSIRDEQELSFLPAYDKSKPAVPVAAIFGANASGKSNLLDALAWMRDAVLNSFASWQPGAGVLRTPFRLDSEAAARPSVYCVEIVVDDVRHTYGFEVDDERVREEWLYAYPHNRRRIIFERDRRGVRFGSTVPDYRSLDVQFGRQTRFNALLLTVAAHSDVAEVSATYQWFRSSVVIGDAGDLADHDLVRRLQDDRERASLLPLIRAADLGIRDVTVEHDHAVAILSAELSATARENALALHESRAAYVAAEEAVSSSSEKEEARAHLMVATQARERAEHVAARLRDVAARLEEIRSSPPQRLVFHHGGTAPLALDDQSAGTRSWIRLVSAALAALDGGGLLVVDEVDASLHPHLSAQLINLFRDPETNPSGAQLLVTSHDPTLLDEDTLSRDEIWFVEKDPDTGATRLFALADFRPRKNENTEGRYLAGSYGAIPIVSDYGFREALRSRERNEAAA